MTGYGRGGTGTGAGAKEGFPFDHEDFVVGLVASYKSLRLMTGSSEILRGFLAQAEAYMAGSQCSLNKALEKLCDALERTFGKGIHYKFWQVAKALCDGGGGGGDGGGGRGRQTPSSWRRPHPSAPCMMTDLVAARDAATGEWVYTPRIERWTFSPRVKVPLYLELADKRRLMNFQILETVYHHQLENRATMRRVPDIHVIFLALTFAHRGSRPNEYSAMLGSYFGFLAAQYDLDDGKTTFTAFKGLRRWRSLPRETVVNIGIRSTLGWRTTPRHHQLWHFQRLVNEMDLCHMQSTIQNGVFLLLLGTIQDHVFASIPPEDAAQAVFVSLFKLHGKPPTNRQRFDISRILQALRLPRSPYLDVLFPDQYRVTVETWVEMLA